MIEEDYVSFETAKLLNKKGFDCECIGYYVYYEPDNVKYSLLGKTNSTWGQDVYSAPTLQMAMKWLRVVCKCYMHIVPFYQDMNYSEPPKWLVAVDANGNQYPTIDNRFETYEQACEAAIKYCLENLI